MSADGIKRTFRRMAGVSAEAGSEELLVPAAHGLVHVRVAGNSLSFGVPIPEHRDPGQEAVEASVYRDQASQVVRTLRPMRIRLRAETEQDAQHVSSGIAREFRTGDIEFDEEVYVDTDCEDAALRMVLNDEVCGAALAVVRLSSSAVRLEQLTIDDEHGRVNAAWNLGTRSSPADLTPEQARAMVAMMDLLAAALPPVASIGRRPVRTAMGAFVRAAHIVMFLGLAATPLAVCGSGGMDKLDMDFAVRALSVAGATAATLIVLTMRFLRGRSSSPDTRRTAVAVSMWLSLEVGVLAARFLW